ncbi:hypothetical protein IQ37_06565 [Chryseobacterium piperi]|uniref:Uncharacterized protein n=1 Tax=Chryseobacterium piperi TaxID=558152 RepID=A0A086BJV2_9FLAO|nr:hypothetical protein [Chryseobacterium piperi]ASW73771.1 hypothetical protein CJF12_05360 [Chryseobacterium piperi]KFF29216.1 hypothetical protein IQ37_06565 [Chryseobacterium piperi]
MKKVYIVFFAILVFSCNNKISQPIVDYSTDYTTNDRMLSMAASLNKQKQQTLILIDNKQSDFNKLQSLIDKKRIKNLVIIKDSTEIQKLNYSYDKVKTIIVATKD